MGASTYNRVYTKCDVVKNRWVEKESVRWSHLVLLPNERLVRGKTGRVKQIHNVLARPVRGLPGDTSISAHTMRNDQGPSCLLHCSCMALPVQLFPINHAMQQVSTSHGPRESCIVHSSTQATRIGQSLGYTLKLIIQVIIRRPVGGPASNLRRQPFPQWP